MFFNRKKEKIEKFYASFNCMKCRKHMEEVMAGNRCRHCLKRYNEKRKPNNRLPQTPNVLQSHLAKVARRLINLPIPGDALNLDRQLVSLALNSQNGITFPVSNSNSLEDWPPHVKKYLKNLIIIMVEPIKSYTAQSMHIFKTKMVDAQAIVLTYSENKCFTGEKKVMLVDMGINAPFSFDKIQGISEKAQAPIVNFIDFLYSIKTGICSSYARRPDRMLTPLKEDIMWMGRSKIMSPSQLLNLDNNAPHSFRATAEESYDKY